MRISTPIVRRKVTERVTVLGLALATAALVGTAGASGAAAATGANANANAATVAVNGSGFPVLPVGAHVLKSGSNQYGSYEFVQEPAAAPHISSLIMRPASGGGCNYFPLPGNNPGDVCLSVTGSGNHVDQMINTTNFAVPGNAEVQILSPSKAQLASWFGPISNPDTVKAYWTPNSNEPLGWYCAASTSNPNTILSTSASYCVDVS